MRKIDDAIFNEGNDDDEFYRYYDGFNLTEAEASELVKRNRKMLRREYSEEELEELDDTIKNTWEMLNDYIANNGIPATLEHDDLYGDALDEYYEKNGGANFEDCRTIIED